MQGITLGSDQSMALSIYAFAACCVGGFVLLALMLNSRLQKRSKAVTVDFIFHSEKAFWAAKALLDDQGIHGSIYDLNEHHSAFTEAWTFHAREFKLSVASCDHEQVIALLTPCYILEERDSSVHAKDREEKE